MKIAIGIPTSGRAAVLREMLSDLQLQTRLPDRIVVCGAQPADVEGVERPGVQVLLSLPGLPRQRNAILAAIDNDDVIVFFDDDFFPAPSYLAAIERHMADHPATVVATGSVLADGIGGPGLGVSDARDMVIRPAGQAEADRPVFSGYGCNMALRLAPMRAHGLLFDERLPLYGWQEDVDLSRRLAAYGLVMRVAAARGVHLGVKSGRSSGLRLGYSQVANPLYLAAKGCGYPWMRALSHIARNVAMNALRAARPEAHIDRRGRVIGNLLATRDLITGKLAPERILEL